MPVKFTITVFYFFLFLASCQSIDKTESLSNKFKPYLNGIWVVADYIEDVTKTRSPLISSDKLTFITEFVIDTAGIAADSVHIGAGMGNHEGMDFVLYFRKGKTSSSLLTDIKDFENAGDSYELGYSVSNTDTSLILYHYNDNKKLLDKTKYIKSPKRPSPENLNEGLQYMVNKNLLAGSYKVIDTSGGETAIILTPEGRIKGLKEFRNYFVLTDFVAAPGNTTDEICFEIQTSHQKCYGFEYKNDTLCLFEPAKDDLDSLFKPGPALYKFIKQH